MKFSNLFYNKMSWLGLFIAYICPIIIITVHANPMIIPPEEMITSKVQSIIQKKRIKCGRSSKL